MARTRGFAVGRRMVKAFKWFVRPRRRCASECQLGRRKSGLISKIGAFAGRLRCRAKRLCSREPEPGYLRLDGEEREPLDAKPAAVPKGHLAVYVGERDDDACRILVPVIYFNHPLFGELLKEAERAFGFNHPGGITIPCRIDDFEKVKTKIAAGDHFFRRPKPRPKPKGSRY